MSRKEVEEQIKVIEEATRKATASKKSAIKFLTEAGIYNNPMLQKNWGVKKDTNSHKGAKKQAL